VIAGRSEGKVQWAADYINAECRKSGGNGEARAMLIDLESFDSVLGFAVEFGLLYDKLDVLICNAGIMNARYHLTENGYESHFQVNYLSQFLLVRLMLPYLRESSDARLISVTSKMGEKAESKTISGLESIATTEKKHYASLSSYRESKFAQMLMTRHLNQLYNKFLFTAAVHPGFVNTDLFYRRLPKGSRVLFKPLEWVGYVSGILKTPYKGADTTIWLAAESDPLPSGEYWYERQQRKWPPAAMNDQLASQLWDWSGQQVEPFLGEDTIS
jgi:dehydrogenase/reductase SDR family protein 13